MKPIILITGGSAAAANGTPQWSINRNYAEMIAKAGGIPILAINDDVIAEYVELADGLLLSGGKDIATNLYGQEQKFDNIFVDEARDIQEWKLLDAFAPTKKPIFGICRGVQVMNAYFGGTLIQDIPAQLGGEHSKGVNHEIEIKKDSILGKLYGESLLINSYHHQGLDEIAEGFIGRCRRPQDGGSDRARIPSLLVCSVASGAYERSGDKSGRMRRLSSNL